jgi:AAA+ ATPase superfamily predicted ATPase
MTNFIFDREEELLALKQRLLKKNSFLFHGPVGVGKTLLIRSLLSQQPEVLYCGISGTAQTVFRNIARELLDRREQQLVSACRNQGGIEAKSAVSLKGIIMDTLRQTNYSIVLDHLTRPSQSFALSVREIISWGTSPVIAIARSSHMEDTGFLQSLYSDRSEKYELRNFDIATALRFAEDIVSRVGLSAGNVGDLVRRVVEFSDGNPGAICSMLQMANYPKYRTDDFIKITPLYIDFRMNWSSVDRRHKT